MANLSKTKKSSVGIVATLLLVILFSGCTSFEGYPENSAFFVVGDVEQTVKFSGNDVDGYYDITDEGIDYKAVSLETVITMATPITDDYSVLLVGKDGLTSEISNNKLNDCHIAYTDALGWQHITNSYPISSRIKLIDKIVVVSNDVKNDYAGFSDDQQTTFLSAGSIYKSGYSHVLNFEGKSEIGGETVTVYTRTVTVPLSQLLDFESSIGIYTKDGNSFHDRPNENSAVLFLDNSISYIKSSGEIVENVAGIVSDPSLFSISELYGDILRFIQNGEKVFVIELDGFGKNIYDKADEQGFIPFISSLDLQTANAFYPTISNVNLATMVTGKKPFETGVLKRGDKEFNGQDIFEVLKEQGKTSVYIEGSMTLLDTSIQPILSVPKEGESSDVAVFNNTLEAIKQNPDFIYTHFHGIDDDATEFGPYSEQNMATVQQIDSFVKQLADIFDGTIIIIADHGVDEFEDAGAHGFVSKNNIIVPYIIYKG